MKTKFITVLLLFAAFSIYGQHCELIPIETGNFTVVNLEEYRIGIETSTGNTILVPEYRYRRSRFIGDNLEVVESLDDISGCDANIFTKVYVKSIGGDVQNRNFILNKDYISSVELDANRGVVFIKMSGRKERFEIGDINNTLTPMQLYDQIELSLQTMVFLPFENMATASLTSTGTRIHDVSAGSWTLNNISNPANSIGITHNGTTRNSSILMSDDVLNITHGDSRMRMLVDLELSSDGNIEIGDSAGGDIVLNNPVRATHNIIYDAGYESLDATGSTALVFESNRHYFIGDVGGTINHTVSNGSGFVNAGGKASVMYVHNIGTVTHNIVTGGGLDITSGDTTVDPGQCLLMFFDGNNLTAYKIGG